MVNLVDEALRGPLFERPPGFAAADVIVADPAVGTGTFLLGVLRRIAATVTADQGAGAVRGAIEAAAKRLIGFEIQFGPFAVAQLRLIAELQALMNKPPLPELRLFITDTLGNPFIEEEQLGQTYEPIAISRRRREQGQEGGADHRRHRQSAIQGEGGRAAAAGSKRARAESSVAPLDRWRPPPEWGVGRARQAPEEFVRLFLALGDVEGLWLRQLRGDRQPGQGRGRHRLFHHGRRVSQRPWLRKNAR